MITDAQRRCELIRSVGRMSSEELLELGEFLTLLDKASGKENNVLSYSGTWHELDEDTFNELSSNLHKRRIQNP